jgi:phosphoethanolamine N-methyltransferase
MCVGRRFMQMLRPGGRLLISDYCRKAGAVSKGFEKYIKARGYDLHR